uniref:3-phosphoshikimate 1-carboxyvinyltransferase n=1 Tax=Candidatus Aschnera chinzeii TaxID=1485666 RepID=A0AAT9G3W1_9ENTR|nr:MAG: 3-phosphoshikimate 1-carboxyvinyltransferase [Candidatus Aschnera chinzeii]
MKKITLHPISYVSGNVNLPGSKSISNRILLLSALSNTKTVLKNLLNSEDVNYMLNALKILGISCDLSDYNKLCVVHGSWNDIKYQKKQNSIIFLGNSGTSMRLLTAVLAVAKNINITLTGNLRMQHRPIDTLVNGLQQCGAKIKYLNNIGYPPIKIYGGFKGGYIIINESVSSQFISAILLAAPLAERDTIIEINCKVVSTTYIQMTIEMMRHFMIKIDNKKYNKFYIKGNQEYISPKTYFIEGDATAASYFLAAAAIKGKSVIVNGVGKNSIQGDLKFAKILNKLGAIINIGEQYIKCEKYDLSAIDIDMGDFPDSAMTLAMLALFAHGEMIIRNIYNWRVKETDRLHAMSTELIKIGALVKEGYDYIRIISPKSFRYACINTYDDHRIAMCFSLVALSNVSVTILNPNCVRKTFPCYFHEFKKISY